MSACVGAVSVLGDVTCREHEDILTPDALQFLGELHVLFNNRRKDLLHARLRRRMTGTLDNNAFVAAADVLNATKPLPAAAAPAGGAMRPDFLPETMHIRADKSWRVASIPADLLDRHVEITGPVDRKMVINALNSGARVFMADFEDSHAPTWHGNLTGQVNLRDAVRGTISLEVSGKRYALRTDGDGPRLATLMVRPRGWHLPENHIVVNGEPVSGSLFDFGLYFYHNAHALLARGSGPYFYLPKMESYLEARLWNDVFAYAQRRMGIRYGTVRATCLIETLPAAFQMDEILYELRHHSAGLNCGRWDYIFSAIKTLGAPASTSAAPAAPAFVLPDRQEVTMTVPWMAAYVRLLIHTCHKRGAHAMGGMSAQIPIKDDAAANDAALAKVRADKEREVTAGHDGTWVAHPALIPVAREVFKRHMQGANQIPTEVLGVARVGNLDPLTGSGHARFEHAGTSPDAAANAAAAAAAAAAASARGAPSTSRLAGVFGVSCTSPATEDALRSLEESLVCAGDRAAGPCGVVTAVAAALAQPAAAAAKGPSASPVSLFARGSTRPLGRFADTAVDLGGSSSGNGAAYGAVDASVGRFAAGHTAAASHLASAAAAATAAGQHGHWLLPEGDWEERAHLRSVELFGSTDWDETRLGQAPSITAHDLTTPNAGNITLSGVRTSVSVAVQYVEAFLRGVGCIPLFNMMEDAATAEICRVQLWQYARFGVMTACGTKVTPALIRAVVKEHSDSVRKTLGDDKYWKSKFALAHDILLESLLRPTLDDFITSKCYPYICTITHADAKL